MREGALIGRMVGLPWAMMEPTLHTLAELAQRQEPDPQQLAGWKALMQPREGERRMVAFRPAAELPGARSALLRDGVAVLPLAGPIFRYANLFTQMSGATSLGDFALDLQLAREDSRVRAILLEVNSPGGQADGIAEAAAAIRAAAADKPVVAFVDGVAGSAAYWLASAASQLVLSPTATVGCLGVVAMFSAPQPGPGRPLEIVSSQTPNKRPDPHTDAGRAKYQTVIDRTADVFLSAVADYRGMTVEKLLQATDGGGLVVGDDAVAGGLADRIGGFEETLAQLAQGTLPARPRVRAAPTPQTLKAGGLMADQNQPPAPTPETPADVAPPAVVPPRVAALPDPLPQQPQAPQGAAALPAFSAENAAAIVELCALAGQPQAAAGFIREGKTKGEVSEALLRGRAAQQEQTPISGAHGVQGGSGQSRASNPADPDGWSASIDRVCGKHGA